MASKFFEQKPWFRSLKSKSQSDLARTKRIVAGAAVDAEDDETVKNTNFNRSPPKSGDQNAYTNNMYSSFKGQNFNLNGRYNNRQDHYLESKSTNDFFSKPKQHMNYRNNNNNNRINQAANAKNFHNGYQNRQNRNQQPRIQSIYLDDRANNSATTIIVSEQAADESVNQAEIPIVAYVVEDVDDTAADDTHQYADGEEQHVVLDDAEFTEGSSDLSDDWDNLNENQRKNDDLIESLKRQIDFLSKQLSEADKDDSSFINDLNVKIENIAQMSHVSCLSFQKSFFSE
jgi:hypothetical protein